ncbi:hypothetical protein vipetofem_22 [Enterococcus phage vipetofem]|uniref:BppU N-terminal domain-containing protein n=1 Tax=Enterococcus phage vipetofem TaxID=2719594 RepID=A0A6G9LL01_9CAUD|nr:virion structural protein [Enterococcus phage vipetofem]QIQ66320.1 hypothetical protein vipetofem_22 [Enterococcus phage vipetofem]
MANNKVLRLDITKTPDLVPTIYGRVADGLVQTVDVYVTNNGEPFDITGWTIKFEGNTSGNRTFIADSEHIKVIDAKGGFFQYTFPLPAFANSGKYERAYFSFALDEKHESSNNFNIQVFKNADITVEEAHTVITEYEKLVDELNKIFIEAQEDLTNDVEEYKQWLTQQVQELQNKIDILNTNYEAAEARVTELEKRLQELINKGLLKMEDVVFFMQGKTTVTIDGQEITINDVMPTFDYLKNNYYTKTEVDQKDAVLDTKIDGVQTNLNNAKTDLENKIEQTYNAQPLPSGVTSLSALSDYSGKTFYITKSQMDALTDNSDLPAEIVGSYNYIVENSESRAGTYRQQFVYTTSVSKRDRYSRVILNGGSKTPFERIITEHKYGLLEFKDAVVNVQDWDTLTATGVYTVYNASGANKPPGGVYGTLVVLADNATVTQEYTSGGKRFIRTRAGSPAVWKDWAELVSKTMMDSELKLRDNEIEAIKTKKVRWEGWFDKGNNVSPIRNKSRLGWGDLNTTVAQVDGVPMDDVPFEFSRLYFKALRDVKFWIEGSVRAQGPAAADTSRWVYWHLRINTDQSETTGTAIHVASTNGQNGGVLQWKNFGSFGTIVTMKAGEYMAFSVDLEDGKQILQADLQWVHVKCLN